MLTNFDEFFLREGFSLYKPFEFGADLDHREAPNLESTTAG